MCVCVCECVLVGLVGWLVRLAVCWVGGRVRLCRHTYSLSLSHTHTHHITSQTKHLQQPAGGSNKTTTSTAATKLHHQPAYSRLPPLLRLHNELLDFCDLLAPTRAELQARQRVTKISADTVRAGWVGWLVGTGRTMTNKHIDTHKDTHTHTHTKTHTHTQRHTHTHTKTYTHAMSVHR